MPGIVIFNRRWSAGSDDFVVPGAFLFILHTVWLIALTVILTTFDFGQMENCILRLHEHMIGYVVILAGCSVVEACIAWVSLRGTILDSGPRAAMEYLLYVRLGIFVVELAWLVMGLIWVAHHYSSCPAGAAKEAVLGIIICDWCVLLSVLITVWCIFDNAGRSWVKMKRYHSSLKDSRAKFNYKRSGSLHRDWRHRKVVRAYQESWNTRCRMLFCCMGRTDRNRNSFADIAKLLSDFFRDLDVVPSDVIAGLVLLRQLQKLERCAIVAQKRNDTYEFLSGIPITPRSRFLALNDTDVLDEFKNVIHYMHYALAVYGWPLFMKDNPASGLCRLCPSLRCCCCLARCCKRGHENAVIYQDNCCNCNYAAMLEVLGMTTTTTIVYVTYHVEVGETPFFVAVDHAKKKIVVSIRGTLSLKDVITDLNAEGEPLPVDPPREEWIGHKGMVQAAEYIRRKLREEMILSRAFGHDVQKGTQTYEMVLVGHSLGAGTAAILAILLRQEYPKLQCYAYSPPGGLLSMPAVEYTKSFITSVVVGKDVVPRIGLHQMEALRSDLINAIKKTDDPKWKVIFSSMFCCNTDLSGADPLQFNLADKGSCRDAALHPSDGNIALTVHEPLFPPGRIIHVVRHHPTKSERILHKPEPVYQALWAENTDFDEVLISPVMVQDHMPDNVLAALQKVLSSVGPAKPLRVLSGGSLDRHQLLPYSPDSTLERTPPHCLCLETSFTDLQPEADADVEASALLPKPDNASNGKGNGNGNGCSPQFITGSPTYTVSWDISNHNEEDRLYRGGNFIRKTTPPRSLETNNLKFDLLNDEWPGMAPIATPETLSDSSSICSRASSLMHQPLGARLSSGSGRMETIVQSPSTAPNHRGCWVDVERTLYDGHVVLTEAVVEPEPALRPLCELEIASDGPVYEGGRLSFDLSQDNTPTSRTSEDTGYHGDVDMAPGTTPPCAHPWAVQNGQAGSTPRSKNLSPCPSPRGRHHAIPAKVFPGTARPVEPVPTHNTLYCHVLSSDESSV